MSSNTATLQPIFEVTKIKVEKRKLPKKYLPILEDTQINSNQVFAEIAKKLIGDEEREIFLVAALNTNYEVIALYKAHIGTATSCEVSVREVFKFAVSQHASSILLCHNHPQNLLQPSKADLNITERLVSAGKLLDIPVIEHIIVTKNNCLFLKEQGYM